LTHQNIFVVVNFQKSGKDTSDQYIIHPSVYSIALSCTIMSTVEEASFQMVSVSQKTDTPSPEVVEPLSIEVEEGKHTHVVVVDDDNDDVDVIVDVDDDGIIECTDLTHAVICYALYCRSLSISQKRKTACSITHVRAWGLTTA